MLLNAAWSKWYTLLGSTGCLLASRPLEDKKKAIIQVQWSDTYCTDWMLSTDIRTASSASWCHHCCIFPEGRRIVAMEAALFISIPLSRCNSCLHRRSHCSQKTASIHSNVELLQTARDFLTAQRYRQEALLKRQQKNLKESHKEVSACSWGIKLKYHLQCHCIMVCCHIGGDQDALPYYFFSLHPNSIPMMSLSLDLQDIFHSSTSACSGKALSF